MTQSLEPSHYSFGDSDLASQRLSLLAATYAPSSRELLREFVPLRAEFAIDLGCGPGHTTALLASFATFGNVVGYERSTRYLAEARARYPALSFHEQDLLSPPFPHRDADVVYCRFLLTHLHDPKTAMSSWLSLLKPGGILILEETAHLASPVDAFQKYYLLVAEMQANYGQELHIGRRLDGFARRTCQRIQLSRQMAFSIEGQKMARLHAMNLATWKHDPKMRQQHGLDELEELERELTRLANHPGVIPPVTSTMAQLVLEG
jgi:SAM-dependent methyltransferase